MIYFMSCFLLSGADTVVTVLISTKIPMKGTGNLVRQGVFVVHVII